MIENYKIALEVVRDWFIGKMEESFNNQEVPDNFKQFMREQGVPTETLVKLIEINPRSLFDVFDDNDVIINIIHNKGLWTWDVNTVKGVDYYSSRKLAETRAVERAFQILDDKLSVVLYERPDSSASDSEVPTEE
jgi:hypothetical protein